MRYYIKESVCDFNIIDKNKKFSMLVEFTFKSYHNWLIIFKY